MFNSLLKRSIPRISNSKIDRLSFYRTLFIQTQKTPNENALKFIPSSIKILPSKDYPTLEINSLKDALSSSELAFKLFSINDPTKSKRGIKSILFGYDFITVEKYAAEETDTNFVEDQSSSSTWALLKPEIFAILTEFLNSGQSVLSKEYINKLQETKDKENELNEDEEDIDEVVELIQELLVTRIQPAIQEDGGDIKFVRFDEDSGTVYLKLIGACKSCSSSSITLKNGIEGMLKYYIDEVKNVEQILDEDATEGSENENSVDSESVSASEKAKTTQSQTVKSNESYESPIPPSL
ncbi:binding protein [[Candida] boidinii]|nr:binding protein [[Candida] boidinii]GMF27532.1 unnamed protein product [[Candida] boidinii]